MDGIKFVLYPAGHVLGAAMVCLEIDGVRVLYTGDYSMEEDRHLMQAEAPVDNPPNVLIIESTFGKQVHEPREIREARFIGAFHARWLDSYLFVLYGLCSYDISHITTIMPLVIAQQ